MSHKAQCQCGALAITSERDPDFVVACNCRACQKRTGAAFGVGAYFRKAEAAIDGVASEWHRTAPSGRSLTNHFCPSCGTTVFWSLEMRPDHLGVAYGCLDSEVPEPSRAIWTSEKHEWVSFPDAWPTYEHGSPEK